METRIHTASNLYKYIENARQMENLELQIKSKEEELKYLDEAIKLYDRLGCIKLFEKPVQQYNLTKVGLLRLKLKKNLLERYILEFELAALTDD